MRQATVFRVTTIEGIMTGKAGDWLVLGVDGEEYPMDHAIFCKSYDPVDYRGEAMMKDHY